MNKKKKIFVLLAIIIFLFFISHFTPLKNYLDLDHIRAIKNLADQHPFWGPILFLILSFFLITIGIPKSIICMAAGITFGFWKGLVLASIGIISGSLVIFIIARSLGAPFFYEKLESYLKIIKEYKGNQFIMVLLIKQIPMPCLLNNTLLGLTSISMDIFIAGSLIGQLPTNVIFTLYGSSVHGNLILKVSIASILTILFFAFLKFVFSKSELMKKLG